MQTTLGKNAYGKNAVNLSRIIRHNDHHEFRQVSVNVSLQGDFETAHTAGDNSAILPTDTQKNTVYVLAKSYLVESIEAFALQLADHFMVHHPHLSEATIEITEHGYQRLTFKGSPHPHAFQGGGSEKHTATVTHSRASVVVHSGIKDLLILKTTDSGFDDYLRDEYTTLKETKDRILATQCSIDWRYLSPNPDFTRCFDAIRTSLLSTFATHKSLSLQHTMYAMGENVLKEVEEVEEISFRMPNKHHILFNLEQFGIENNNEIFIAMDEPYGLITGSVFRTTNNE
jgi:urate oxidase